MRALIILIIVCLYSFSCSNKHTPDYYFGLQITYLDQNNNYLIYSNNPNNYMPSNVKLYDYVNGEKMLAYEYVPNYMSEYIPSTIEVLNYAFTNIDDYFTCIIYLKDGVVDTLQGHIVKVYDSPIENNFQCDKYWYNGKLQNGDAFTIIK